MNFRSAMTGRWVSRLFARSKPTTWMSAGPTYYSVPTQTGTSTTYAPKSFTVDTSTFGTEATTTSLMFTPPNPYPFPKAQIRCPHCDKLTPIDAACVHCQSELDGGDAA